MKGARQAPQTSFRMPKELKDFVQQKASESRRSLNAEMLCLIEKGIESTYGKQHAA